MRPIHLQQALASASTASPRALHTVRARALLSIAPRAAAQPFPLPLTPNRGIVIRYASNVPSSSSQQAPLQMPLDQPREDYAAPAMYTLSYLARIIRFLLYGVVSLGAAGLMTFEGMHFWIEHVALGAPAGPSVPFSSSSSKSASLISGGGADEYGWQEENVSWTGGSKGGTDSRLGYKARHALRAAWICKEIGAGGAASIGSGRGHGSRSELAGMIGATASARLNKVDRGYELAEEYIDVAIGEAKRKGLVFPVNLPGARIGPAYMGEGDGSGVKQVGEVDQTALDLLLLKAGILERISTHDSLLHAKDLYEQVLAASTGQTHLQARDVRLSSKIGDLESKTGGDGMAWWSWSLRKANVDVVIPQLEQRVEGVEKQEKRGWFGFWGSSTTSTAADVTQPASSSTPSAASATTSTGHMSPVLLRAAVSTLISAEAHLAQGKNFREAAHYQDLALSLIPPTSTSASKTGNPSAALHELWLTHRRALLTLHKTSVTHALRQPALDLATSSTDAAESVITSLPTLPSASNVLYQSMKLLNRDSLLLAAEANYTKALLLEKTGDAALDSALEGFERAMTLSGMESGGEEGVKGEEWGRYWRGYARVRERLHKMVEK